jgi:hypothetical protein
MVYPIVQYAHIIGKNTAEFTVKDLTGFMKWWLTQPIRKDIVEATEAQRKVYEEDVRRTKLWKEDQKVRKHTTKKYEEAQTSRLAERGIESPINDEEEEIIIHPENEVVCEIGLTKTDIMALLFSIKRTYADYDVEGTEYDASLKSILEVLEGV